MADCSVLVVEDDEDSREAMMDVLRFEGYHVEGATNGQAALDLLHSGRFKPDVIVVDLHMPAMDGHDLRLALGDDARFADIPVIFCTGESPRSVAPGAFGTLQKPVDIETLVSVVRRGCASHDSDRRASA
jgi:CheY-like chemotaxis protein